MGIGPKGKYSGIYWDCVCECGNTCTVLGASLNSKSVKSCGCLTKQDLTGLKVGLLTVVRLTDPREHSKRLWLCKCDCGNTKLVSTGSLNTSNVQSCGCILRKDITGQKFGKLTAVEMVDGEPGGVSYRWLCKCECGGERLAAYAELNNSRYNHSCGCINLPDLTGHKFTRLTVLGLDTSRVVKGTRHWECVCECNVIVSVSTSALLGEETHSCGCYGRERVIEANTTHGMTGTAIYRIYRGMLNRCYWPSSKSYHRYGGRGIFVCDRWRESFENFYEDMGDPPPKHSLDRRDNDGPYSPENCRWSTAKEQGRNKSDTAWVEYRGERVKRIELTDRYGVDPTTFRQRLDNGWDVELALTPPVPSRTEQWGVMVVLNLETREIVFGSNTAAFEDDHNLDRYKVRSAGTYKVPIDGVWLAKSLEDTTPWNDFRGCTGVSEEVILKQPNEPHVIFSNVREAYRYLTEHSLLDKEYTLKVFE